MGTYRSIEDYRQSLIKRMKMLNKETNNISLKTSNFMIRRSRKFAPIHSGETIRGIRRRKNKTGYQVESKVEAKGKTGFRQNLWANQTKPFRKPHMVWNNGQPTLYGQGHRLTGKPRFFHFATLDTRVKFNKIGRKSTLKILKVQT
jgi:hypothetical protein